MTKASDTPKSQDIPKVSVILGSHGRKVGTKTMKNHVKTALAKVPGIHDTIQEQIDNSPDKKTIKSYVSDFFKSLPESWSHPAIDEARDSVLETIDSLPEKDYVKEQVSSFAEKVPSSDKINEYVDDYVEVLGTAVDELNNVPSDAVDA